MFRLILRLIRFPVDDDIWGTSEWTPPPETMGPEDWDDEYWPHFMETTDTLGDLDELHLESEEN